jgi:hypothetical protein
MRILAVACLALLLAGCAGRPDLGDETLSTREFEKTGPETWRGTAPGVLGTATGEERGDAFNWRYRIDLPVPDGTLRVSFDDWMWQVSETRVLNRAYMDKLGVEIGEVIIWFEKQG